MARIQISGQSASKSELVAGEASMLLTVWHVGILGAFQRNIERRER